jgi:hypothetical protein
MVRVPNRPLSMVATALVAVGSDMFLLLVVRMAAPAHHGEDARHGPAGWMPAFDRSVRERCRAGCRDGGPDATTEDRP